MAIAAPSRLIGAGLYALPEAARLLRVPTRKVRRWALGHTRTYRGRRVTDAPVIHMAMSGTETLTFLDLMELYFVALFREQDVSLPIVRAAACQAACMFGSDHPFVMQRFDTDGKAIFATLQRESHEIDGLSGEELMVELHKGQHVFGHIVRPFFRKLEYADLQVSRYWPRGKAGAVVIDPARAFGRPIVAAGGVPTHALYQAAASGETLETIARWYDLPVKAVQSAVEYERSLDAAQGPP